jgi:signal transduction histidine kinase
MAFPDHSPAGIPVGTRGRTIVDVLFQAIGQRFDATLNPMYGRFGLAAVTGFVAVGVATGLPDRASLAVAGACIAVAAAVPLFLSRPRFPFALAVASTAGIALLADAEPGNLAWFGVCVLGGWCALGGGRLVAGTYWIAALVMFGAEWLFAVHDAGWGAWTAGVSFTVLAAFLIRHQLTLVEQMRRLQADLAERSRAEERSRIARDLHDVIAHSLTVSLLHVSSARLAVEHDPEDAARALADAERLTRQSLSDVRATVGLLRAPGDEGIAPPAPGIDELARLVEDLRGAHVDVSLTVEGSLEELPSTTGTTVYRIVQESLTNASRHARGSRVEVRIAALDGRVDVAVESAGPPGTGTGMGLVNMRERAEAVGGTLHAGPGGAGWLVRASLPTIGLPSIGLPSIGPPSIDTSAGGAS